MLGTMVNVASILTGSIAGSLFKKGIGEKYNHIMLDAMGLSALALGVHTSVSSLGKSEYHVLFIISLALGGILGTALDLSGRFDRLLSACSSGSNLARGLSTAILLYCLGTFSILGPIQSALYGDNTFLFTNAMLDGLTSFILASTFGIGIALAAVAVFCWQGSLYLMAGFIEPFLTDSLMTEISIIGGVLIMSSALGILKLKEIKTLDLLPALLIPPVIISLLHLIGF